MRRLTQTILVLSILFGLTLLCGALYYLNSNDIGTGMTVIWLFSGGGVTQLLISAIVTEISHRKKIKVFEHISRRGGLVVIWAGLILSVIALVIVSIVDLAL